MAARTGRQTNFTTSSNSTGCEDLYPPGQRQFHQIWCPVSRKTPTPKRVYKNIIYEGLELQAFINSGPSRLTWTQTRKELAISESKLAHLLKIINQLPPDFVENMRSCDDPQILKTFTGRKLLQISRLRTEKERRNEIERLLGSKI